MSTTSNIVTEATTTRLIKYIILQILQIPSLFCFIFIFYCVYHEHKLHRLHNHAMFLILLISFLLVSIELSVTLSFLRRGSSAFHVDQFCDFWIFINYTLEGINTLMMAFASIERFLLIFSPTSITRSRRRRIWFHYVPMISCCIAVIVWYIILVLIYPCVHTYDYNVYTCQGACYVSIVLIGSIDWILSVLLPVSIVIIFNVLILARVIMQKRRLHVPLNWHRTRKMTIQLLAVGFIFLLTQIPWSIFAIIRLIFFPGFSHNILSLWYGLTLYLIYLFTPFAYLATTKEVFSRLTVFKIFKSNRINSEAIQAPRTHDELNNNDFPTHIYF